MNVLLFCCFVVLVLFGTLSCLIFLFLFLALASFLFLLFPWVLTCFFFFFSCSFSFLLYSSQAEATRRKTTDYYDQIRKEEDELKNEQNDMIIQEKRERRVSPTSRTNVEREALYRKLRGGDQ